MKILITGGCGFVGSNLALLFKQYYTNAEIYCLDNLSRRGSEVNLQKILAAGVNFVHGDVRVKTDFSRIQAVDIVIDAAAEPSVLAGKVPGELENLIDTNLNGTINTLYFAKKYHSPIIFLSTSRVYPYATLGEAKLIVSPKRFDLSNEQTLKGLAGNGVSEEFPLEGLRSLYGASKLASEYFIQEFTNNFNFPAVINRCSVLSGPFQMGKVDQGVIVLWMAKHFWKGKLSYIGYGGLGQQVRDVLHIRDLFRLVQWQISNIGSQNGKVFNVGGGFRNTVSLAELTELCEQITGNSIEISSSLENRPGDLPIFVTDNSKIAEHSGWKPEVGMETILQEIFEWIKNDHKTLKSILS